MSVTPHVSPTDTEPTHDLVLTDGSSTYGFLYAKGVFEGFQETPLSASSKQFKLEQKTWTGGRGKERWLDPSGFLHSRNAWTTTEARLYPSLLWRFARGLVSEERNLPDGSVRFNWQDVDGLVGVETPTWSNRRISQAFTAGSTFTATKIYVWARKRDWTGSVGEALTLAIYSDADGSPNESLASGAVTQVNTTGLVEDEGESYLLSASISYELQASTVYHVVITDSSSQNSTATYHYEVGMASATSNLAKVGTYTGAPPTWSYANIAGRQLYFRITSAAPAVKWHPFRLMGADYIVSQSDTGANAVMYINGDRGTASSSGGGVLTDATHIGTTGKTWTADRWIGAWVKIVGGTGQGQTRAITDNDATNLTVATWDVTPDNTSLYVIYATDWWTLVGTTGLAVLSNPPLVVGQVVYFPQGSAVNVRRMTYTAGAHAFADDGSNKYHLLGFHTKSDGTQYVAGFTRTGSMTLAPVVVWNNNLTYDSGTTKQVGDSDSLVTSAIVYDNALHVFKENGLYKILNGIPGELAIGGMKSAPLNTNGAYSCTHNLWLYFLRANSVVQLQGENAADIENFSVGYSSLPSYRRGSGTLTSAEGWVFRSIDGGATGVSTVHAWNGYGWHEIVRGYNGGARIRGCFWQPCEGTNPRLWTEIDNQLIVQNFPQGDNTPLEDSSLYYVHEYSITTPLIEVDAKNLYKLFKEINLVSSNLDGTSGTVKVYYRSTASTGALTRGGWTVNTAFTLETSPLDTLAVDLDEKIDIQFKFVVESLNPSAPVILYAWALMGNLIDELKYQWSIVAAVESDGEDQQGNDDANPDTLLAWLKTCAAQRTSLTVSSQKSSIHGKVVTVEAPTSRMSYIDTEEGSSKWTGTLWFTLREA